MVEIIRETIHLVLLSVRRLLSGVLHGTTGLRIHHCATAVVHAVLVSPLIDLRPRLQKEQ